jgi:hypothetical protein
VIIINETMARMYWPKGNALGQRFKWGSVASEAQWPQPRVTSWRDPRDHRRARPGASTNRGVHNASARRALHGPAGTPDQTFDDVCSRRARARGDRCVRCHGLLRGAAIA